MSTHDDEIIGKAYDARLIRSVRSRSSTSSSVTIASRSVGRIAPWTSAQGHSGYTWSWLGAALATGRLAIVDAADTLVALPLVAVL